MYAKSPATWQSIDIMPTEPRSAADLIKIAMVKVVRAIKEAGLRAEMVLQIHDELVFDVPAAEVEAVKEIARREMTAAYDFGVPLEVGIGAGRNWLAAH